MKKQTNRSQSWPILLFTIGVFMAGLDNGIISTALTTINDTFGVTPAWGAWSITIYTLGVAVSVPIIGKLSDNYGRKRLFIIEVFLFGLGSLLVALSPNFTFLLISRLIQAIGGGGIFIIATSHVLATLPKDRQGKVLGLLGSMHGLSALFGPNIGAVILHMTGTWQWMFLINLPIAAFLIVFGMSKITETKSEYVKPLDMVGTVLLTTGVLLVMLGMTRVDMTQFMASISRPDIAGLFVVGILVLILFVNFERIVEKKGGDPILAYSLLTGRAFQLTLCLGLLSGGFLAGIIFIPSYVQQVLQVPVENAGFWLTPLALASGIGAGLGGFLTDKYGATKTVMFSGSIGLIGFFMFPLIVSHFWTYLLACLLAGIGLGILLGAPLNVLVGASAGKNAQGSALGALSLVRQIGLTLFPLLFASFLTAGYKRVEPVVNNLYGEDVVVFNPEQDGDATFGSLVEQIERIPDLELQTNILDTVSAVLKMGFDHMFITSAILSFIVIVIGTYLSKIERSTH